MFWTQIRKHGGYDDGICTHGQRLQGRHSYRLRLRDGGSNGRVFQVGRRTFGPRTRETGCRCDRAGAFQRSSGLREDDPPVSEGAARRRTARLAPQGAGTSEVSSERLQIGGSITEGQNVEVARIARRLKVANVLEGCGGDNGL